MRYGLLADVHGNLHALRAAVDAVASHGIDRWIFAGDLVGYGPQPNECVELVAGLDAISVAGNHDLIVLGELSDERCITLARESLRWTREVLGADSRAFLAALPRRAEAEGVVVAHGSLEDPQEYTERPEQARRQLAAVPHARALILGHTHRAWVFGDGPLLVNPGAVGQSREWRARARAGVFDTATATATLLAVRYDVEGCRAALRAAGLPERSCHLRPSPVRLAGRTVRRALRATG